MEYLIIDGYNVIASWFDFSYNKKDSPLEDARQQLVEMLSEYQAFTGQYIILVFDAYRSKGRKKIEYFPGIEIRYTDYGQTADSFIESLVTKLAEQKQVVGVVTSDWAQQQIVLGKGARRWSSREFYQEVKKITSQITRAANRTKVDRPTTELVNRLDSKARKNLQKIINQNK
jgi:hypothetical protein